MAQPTSGPADTRETLAADPNLRRAERMAAVILGVFVPVLLAAIALSVSGLLLAPKDDSTLGLMRALVFRCH